MINNKLKALMILVLFFAFTQFSCEKDIEQVGYTLVENNNFSFQNFTSDIIAFSKDVDKVRAKNLPQNLIGVYSDPVFGSKYGSIATQLALPAANLTFGDNPTIDSILIDIPYQATLVSSAGAPSFDLDSIYGDTSIDFNLKVYELSNYLNTLDPTDPTKNLKYFSDSNFSTGQVLYSGTFKANKNDTVAYISRWNSDLGPFNDRYDIDTIKRNNLQPSIKIPLDESYLKTHLIDNVSNELETTDLFQHYFRGLYIEASPNVSPSAHLMSINISAAKFTIYYTNEETVNETATEDLNDNGILGETGIVLKKKQTHNFPFTGVRVNKIDNNYSSGTVNSYLASPNTTTGESKLFVQGGAGTSAVLKLFQNDNLATLRSNNWLINEANIYLYVDQSITQSLLPERLFLFKSSVPSHIADVMTEGINTIGGTLIRDSSNTPVYYKFILTDYISKLLETNSSKPLSDLEVKVYNPTDIPESAQDTIVKNYSWIPKSVVLHGNQSIDPSKAAKLEIFYSKK